MAKVTYGLESPYALTPQSNWAIGNYVHRSIPAQGDDAEYTIPSEYNHRPDILADELYGNPELYWVFMVRNMNVIRDPLWGFEEGLTIYLPSKKSLKKNLGL
jgi:hypothetical protein